MASDAFRSITIKGFRSIRSIENLGLRPVNLLIGSNGSGKSNFIAIFQLLKEIRGGRLREFVALSGGAEKVLYFGSKSTNELVMHFYFNNPENYASGSNVDRHYRIVMSPSADEGLFVVREDVYFGAPPNVSKGFANPLKIDARGSFIIGSPEVSSPEWLFESIDAIGIYHLHDTSTSAPMRKTVNINDNRVLRADGDNLAAFLYRLHQKHKASYVLIRNVVRQVAPFFDDFQLEPLALNPETIKLEWRHKSSDQYFDVSSLSDGTLRFIALATLFLQPVELRPSVILVDEPELGLHPYAIELLASLIRQASRETQVIAATQSPLLLDYFEPEDILVADRVNGATEIRRLEPEPLTEWLRDYSLGQLWEKGELAGRPVKE